MVTGACLVCAWNVVSLAGERVGLVPPVRLGRETEAVRKDLDCHIEERWQRSWQEEGRGRTRKTFPKPKTRT